MLPITTPALLYKLSDGVLILHPGGRPRYVNPAARARLGLAADEPLPENLAPPGEWEAMLAGREQVHLTCNGVAFQASAFHQDNQIVLLLQGEHTRGMAALTQICRELTTTVDPKRILEIVLTKSLQATGFGCGDIVLLDLARGVYTERFSQGCPDSTLDIEQDLEILHAGRSRFIPDLAQASHPGVHTALVIPFSYQASVAGLVHLHSAEPATFDRDAAEFLEAVTAHAAAAIGNAQRFQEQLARSERLHHRAEQVVQMANAGRAIRSDQPFEDILEDLVYVIQEGVGFDIVLLSLVEGKDSERVLRRVAAAGLPLAVFHKLKEVGQPYDVVAALLQDEYRLGSAYLIPEHHQQAGFGSLDTYTPLNAKGALGPKDWHPDDLFLVPLRSAGGEVLGLLSLDTPRNGRRPTEDTVIPIEVFASQAAVALENARLLSDAHRRTQVHKTLLQVGTALVSTLSPAELFQRVVDAAVETLPNATEGVIHLYFADEDQLVAQAVSRTKATSFVPRAGVGMRLGVGVAGRALAEQRIINIPDVQVSDYFFQKLKSPHYHSLLVAPLLAEDRLLGTISVSSPRVAAFSAEDENILALLSTQAAVALENARLHNAGQSALHEIQARADRLATVNRLSAQFGSTLDLQEIMDTVVHEMARITNVDQCRLVLFDPDVGYGTIRAENTPVNDAANRIVPMEGNPSYEMLLQTRRPLAIEDVSTHPATTLLAPRFEADNVKSLLLVPLLVQDRLIGSVGLNVVGQHRKFGDAAIEMCTTVCNQAAIALENARLYEKVRGFTLELEQRVDERTQDLALARDRVEALLRITSELSISMDLDRVLYRALELVGEVVGVNQGAIFLLDQATGELIYRAALGRSRRLSPGGERLPFHRGEGLAGWVVKHRTSAVVNDTKTDERWVSLPQSPENYRSVLAVPLGLGEEVVGLLMLFSQETNAFSESQLQLVEAAGSQVATAISNAELYKYIQEQANLLGGMMRTEREEAAKSAAILESVADGVMVVDAHGKVILFNATAERMLGLERSQVLDEPISKFIGLWGSAGAAWIAASEEWGHTLEPLQSGQFLKERLELGAKVVSVHLAPVLSSDAFPVFLGTVSVFRDITRDVELDRMQREWISTVSHELRTPMTSIKGYADLLILGAAGPISDMQHRFLDVIKNNADRLSLLVNDLLDISRIETGRLKLDFRSIELRELLEMVVDNLHGRREQEGKEIDIQLKLPDNLPPVLGDLDRVAQILTNLLDNAFNYTPAGGSVRVSARLPLDKQRVRIDIIDSGIGISPKDQARIFDRFFRSDDPYVQKVSGTGLGLAIVNHLVEMHGGQLQVFSKQGEGSTFSFSLPIAALHDEMMADE